MAKTSYITTHGRIRGEITNGVMTRYGTDALGSVVATYSGGAAESTYRFKPYGSTLVKTGSVADPSFLWNDGSGYRGTSLASAGFYVRRRHFSQNSGNWTSVDPLWPVESPYVYVVGQVTTRSDSNGLSGGVTITSCMGSVYLQAELAFLSYLCWPPNKSSIAKCVNSCNALFTPPMTVDPGCVQQFCSKGSITCKDCTELVACGYLCDNPLGQFPMACMSTITQPCSSQMPLPITICANSTTSNYRKTCGQCSDNVTSPATDRQINCDSFNPPGLDKLGHELVHPCSPDCALDGVGNENQQSKNDQWGICFAQCVLGDINSQ